MSAVRVIHGDCIEAMRAMPAGSVDSIVTDPPYHLTSIVKRFGKDGSAPAQFGKDGAFSRASAGFMGKTWDGGDIAQTAGLPRFLGATALGARRFGVDLTMKSAAPYCVLLGYKIICNGCVLSLT
jgi:hypothetical protein